MTILTNTARLRGCLKLELHSSFEDIAKLGAFEVLNLADDFLSVDFHEAPKVFSLTVL